MRVVRHCFDVVFASVAGSITRGFPGSILGPILSFFVIFYNSLSLYFTSTKDF